MRPPWIARIAAVGTVAAGLIAPTARAQDTPKSKADEPPKASDSKAIASSPSKFASRQALSDHYQQKFADLDKQRIADLGALAAKLKDSESEAAYSEAFNLAVTRDQYESRRGRPPRNSWKSGKGSPQTKALASFVNLIAASNRGQYDQAVKDLDAVPQGAGGSSATPDDKARPKPDLRRGRGVPPEAHQGPRVRDRAQGLHHVRR